MRADPIVLRHAWYERFAFVYVCVCVSRSVWLSIYMRAQAEQRFLRALVWEAGEGT